MTVIQPDEMTPEEHVAHAIEAVDVELDRRGLLRHATALAAEHGARVLVTSQVVSRLGDTGRVSATASEHI